MNERKNRLIFLILLIAVVAVPFFLKESRKVFVLLTNPHTQNEGIYTIRQGNKQQVIMFEKLEDAYHYDELLQKQKFSGLAIVEIRQWEVNLFCIQSLYECKLVRRGTQLVPPSDNIPIPADLSPK
jgi:hypothetical protein